MANKIIIAIDGPSATGKSTIAQELAKIIKYIHIDTGAMYRAVTLFAINNGLFNTNPWNQSGLIHLIDKIKIEFKYNNLSCRKKSIFLNGKNVQYEIRKMYVSEKVSLVSQILEVRQKMFKIKKKMGENGGVVMEGRDIGTVVFPNAQLKFFFNASVVVRAERRYRELNKKVNFYHILENLKVRDKIDETRINSPLTKAKDAVAIDNTNLSINDQVKFIYNIYKKKYCYQ